MQHLIHWDLQDYRDAMSSQIVKGAQFFTKLELDSS